MTETRYEYVEYSRELGCDVLHADLLGVFDREEEQRKEGRLDHEAHTNFLGRLQCGFPITDSARVEVTYQEQGKIEHCGYFIVDVSTKPSEDLADHPATIAQEVVHEELERRFPDADYLSVDDVYAE